jgi:MFS family permease
MVLVAAVGQCFGVGTMLVYTFGVFAKPLAGEFGSRRAAISVALSALNVMVTLASPGAGRLVDRFGARRVMVSSIAALAACLIALSWVKAPLWHLYALYALGGLLGAGATPVTYSRVVANWFDRRRGIALGLSSAGIGLGAFIMPSLAQWLIDEAGWRRAYIVLGALSLAIAGPAVGIFLRGRPEEVGLAADGLGKAPVAATEPPRGMRVLEAWRTPTFWQLCAIFFSVSACVNGAIAHLAPLLTDHGVSGRRAALATSLFGGATIIGRVGNGFLVDRFFAPLVAAILFAGATAGLAMLWSGVSGSAAFLAAALLGLAIGAEADVMPYLVSRYFGMRSMGELFGCVFGAYTLGFALGPYLMGAGFDATGSYRIPFACAVAVLLCAIVATLGLGPYRQFSDAASQVS